MLHGSFVTAEPWFRIGDPDEIGATERSVGSLRVFLAVVGLIAITVDSTQPALYAGTAYTILVLYIALAAAFLLSGSLFVKVAPRSFAVATHTIDVAVAAAVMLCTEGPDSPFFVFLTFPLLVAAYRWGL